VSDGTSFAGDLPEEPPVSGAPLERRIVAFVIDGSLVSVGAWIVAPLAGTYLAGLGPYGRFVGLGMGALSLGPMNSSLTGGASPGKRVLGLRVVDAEGAPIAPLRSIVRSTVLLLPLMLNGVFFPYYGDMTPLIHAVAGLLFASVLGLGGAFLYLAAFNRPARQLPHDLVARTWVVRADAPNRSKAETRRLHARLAAVWIALVASAPLVAARWLDPQRLAPDLMRVARALHAAAPDAWVTTVQETRGAARPRRLTVAVRMREDRDRQELARRMAGVVLERHPHAREFDTITVAVSYGFEVGFASRIATQIFSHSPDDWSRQLDPQGGHSR
jgi:uncharacterized RDD family membrane protein YckC